MISAFLAACGPVGATGSGGGPNGGGGAGGEGGSGGDGGTGGEAPCEDGATRDCHITLGQHGNVLSCFDGTQTCKSGVWGSCDGTQSDKPKPPPPSPGREDVTPLALGPGKKVTSLSMAAACMNNPCDPSCQAFQEVPPMPVGSPPQNLIAPWLQGSYSGLPPNIQQKGNAEPCSQGSACQFDQYCSNPNNGTCSHHKCVAGAGLVKDCDPCVSKICAGNPSCCTTPVAALTCPHDLCVTGAAISNVGPVCDACVTTVCGSPQYKHCCDTAAGAWTAECVLRVTSACGISCSTGTWSQTCIDSVDSLCDAKCLTDTTPPYCAHDKCYAGAALSAGCDPCVQQICNTNPACCTTAWDGTCLQQVATVCGLSCPAKGDCVPWLPSQVNPSCNSTWDLTVGVPCNNGGVPRFPVCNHGKSASPAGLPLVVLPANAPGFGDSNASLAGAVTTITINQSIAPGTCIDVDLPANTPDGAEIVVNPALAAGYSNAECHGDNNWSLWSAQASACANPSCAGTSAFSKLKKVRIFFSVDMSLSQTANTLPGLPGNPTRWSQVVGALNSFIQDPNSDGVAVWLRMWPYKNPNAAIGACPGPSNIFSAGCGSVAGCKTPDAQVDDLASTANENTILNVINSVVPNGNTPMYPALDGAILAAEANLGIHPDEIPVVVLVTDGNPTQCGGAPLMAPVPPPPGPDVQNIANLAAAGYNGYGVRTYVIGIADVAQVNVDLIAGSGGGKSFFIAAGGNVQVQQQMINALNNIKNDFVSCTLPLPNQSLFDPTKASVIYTPGAGGAQTLMQVNDAASCGAGAGWYYDNNMSPTSITLCNTTCNQVRLDTNGKLELAIPCILQYLPSQYKQSYVANCPVGTAPQWGFFAWDTTVPGDSKIDFRFHTSADGVTYGMLPAMPNATALNANQVCPMGGPSPCPIDIYNALNGLPAARQKYLELVADITPTSDKNKTPKINNWQVTYSCPDLE